MLEAAGARDAGAWVRSEVTAERPARARGRDRRRCMAVQPGRELLHRVALPATVVTPRG